MKILCMCQQGNSRSVALAYLLKENKHESIAIGMLSTSRKTREMLYGWADLIIMVISEKRYRHWIPGEYQHKVKVWDVGHDVFFRDFDFSLKKTFRDYIKREGL
jgi:hypothetical protein